MSPFKLMCRLGMTGTVLWVAACLLYWARYQPSLIVLEVLGVLLLTLVWLVALFIALQYHEWRNERAFAKLRAGVNTSRSVLPVSKHYPRRFRFEEACKAVDVAVKTTKLRKFQYHAK